jgi:hypothetical protein
MSVRPERNLTIAAACLALHVGQEGGQDEKAKVTYSKEYGKFFLI